MSIIHLDDHRTTKSRVTHQDRTLTVFGHEYSVRRHAWDGRKTGGWISVRNAGGEMLFVRPGELPDAVIADLIGAWMDGYGVGRKEAAKAPARGYTGDIV